MHAGTDITLRLRVIPMQRIVISATLLVMLSAAPRAIASNRAPLPMQAEKLLLLLDDAVDSNDQPRVHRIIRTLVVLDHHGKKAIRKRLHEPHTPSLRHVLTALSRMTPNVRRIAAPLLSHSDASIRQQAAIAVNGADHKLLIQAFHIERQTPVRVALIESIANSDHKRAGKFLTRLLRSPDPNIRIAAINGLVLQAEQPPLPELHALTRDAEPTVRRATVIALGTVGESKTLHVLLELVRLEDDAGNVRAIFDALRSLSGQSLKDDADEWQRWLTAGS